MQTYVFVLGILLAGQLGDSSGARYSVLPPDPQAGSHVAEAAQSPVTNRLPAVAQAPATNAVPTGLTKVVRPAEFLRNLAKPVGRENLAGVPLSLADAIQNTRSRAEQTRRVKLYWELSQAVNDFHLASLEELELQSLRNGLGQAGQAWGPAQQAVATRKQLAQSAVLVAQLCLQKELERVGSSNLPLPVDLPHCGAYETKYERIFQGRASREAEQLSALLPLRHKELGRRVADSTSAREWLILVRGQQSPQNDSTQLLKAYEQLALQRQAFVAAAYQYNAEIARYTELAVPQGIATERLVTMLIQSSGDSSTDWQPGNIRRVAAEEEAPQGNDDRYQPRTYAEPGRSETRRVPPIAEKNGERSILVAPEGTER